LLGDHLAVRLPPVALAALAGESEEFLALRLVGDAVAVQ
jgi:hypothetical protein